jgi:hypothetical protein
MTCPWRAFMRTTLEPLYAASSLWTGLGRDVSPNHRLERGHGPLPYQVVPDDVPAEFGVWISIPPVHDPNRDRGPYHQDTLDLVDEVVQAALARPKIQVNFPGQGVDPLPIVNTVQRPLVLPTSPRQQQPVNQNRPPAESTGHQALCQ